MFDNLASLRSNMFEYHCIVLCKLVLMNLEAFKFIAGRAVAGAAKNKTDFRQLENLWRRDSK